MSLRSRWFVTAITVLLAGCGTWERLDARTTETSQPPAPWPADTTSAAGLSAAFRGAAQRAMPSLVRIDVLQRGRTVALQGQGANPFLFRSPSASSCPTRRTRHRRPAPAPASSTILPGWC